MDENFIRGAITRPDPDKETIYVTVSAWDTMQGILMDTTNELIYVKDQVNILREEIAELRRQLHI